MALFCPTVSPYFKTFMVNVHFWNQNLEVVLEVKQDTSHKNLKRVEKSLLENPTKSWLDSFKSFFFLERRVTKPTSYSQILPFFQSRMTHSWLNAVTLQSLWKELMDLGKDTLRISYLCEIPISRFPLYTDFISEGRAFVLAVPLTRYFFTRLCAYREH